MQKLIDEQKFIHDIFSMAGIEINGNQPGDIIVHDNQFYHRLLTNAELAMGETYMEQLWDCEQLDVLFYKILSTNLEKTALSHPKFWRAAINQFIYEIFHNKINRQTKRKSFVVGKRHYDIGNDLYQAMLDKRMVYTCAYWDGANNLDAAQEKKLKLICEKLDLSPGLSVLDIGCGWGSFAKYAAENYGVSVMGVTVSKRQKELGSELCAGLPIEIKLQDYRELLKNSIPFDRVVSLGMFEHVGGQNYLAFMKTVNHCLKEEGRFLLHTIGANNAKEISSKWINKYIFPFGQIPSTSQVSTAYENFFVMEDWQNIGVHYDQTLMAWHQQFNQHWDELKLHYDETFHRMWNYYLQYCAGSFRARRVQVWQILLTKHGLPNGFHRINLDE